MLCNKSFFLYSVLLCFLFILFSELIFLNLRKAFGIVSLCILLSKLHHYGVHGPVNHVIKSFLKRRQYVSVNGTNSDIQLIINGVVQGSTLGPILFLHYINNSHRLGKIWLIIGTCKVQSKTILSSHRAQSISWPNYYQAEQSHEEGKLFAVVKRILKVK